MLEHRGCVDCNLLKKWQLLVMWLKQAHLQKAPEIGDQINPCKLLCKWVHWTQRAKFTIPKIYQRRHQASFISFVVKVVCVKSDVWSCSLLVTFHHILLLRRLYLSIYWHTLLVLLSLLIVKQHLLGLALTLNSADVIQGPSNLFWNSLVLFEKMFLKKNLKSHAWIWCHWIIFS